MSGRGSSSARYAFVADSPTWIDDRNGFILSDRKLVLLLHEAGLAEEDCFFTSIMKCRDEKDPTEHQVSSCLGFILQELSIVKPKVIFAMGKLAFDVLSKRGGKEKIGQLRGRVYDIEMPWGKVALIPTWNVGYAKHKDSAGEDIIADVMTGIARLAPARETHYKWVNDPEELIYWTDNILSLYEKKELEFDAISVDTETTNLVKKGITPVAYPRDHNIGTVQIGWNRGHAIIFPIIRPDSAFNNPYNIVVARNQLQRLLSAIPVVGQNYKFDECYFNTKLGIRTEKFIFDSMLAHHFIYGGSLPNNLGFMVSRHLGWESHKRIIDDALAAMPEDNRRYSLLPIPLLTEYGCKDVDSVLQLYPILRKKMEEENYKRFDTTVVYPNMWEAFQARTMGPWRAILDIERRGALIDMEKVPEVTQELETRMNDAYGVVSTSPPHAVWMLDHTVPNPKRKVFEKAAVHYLRCDLCNQLTKFGYEGKRPKTGVCPVCKGTAKVTWKMEQTDKFTLNEAEPETVVSPINLKSPKQVSEFFYSSRYLGFPVNEELGKSTDKNARAWLLEECEKQNKQVHANILLSIGEFNKAAKLYSSYATKLPEYIFITDDKAAVSNEVTAPFEINTGVFHIHTNYFQDGTFSGRLCVSENTKILTEHGALTVPELASGVHSSYHAYTHQGRWCRITDAYFKGREQMFRFITSAGSFECTANHRIWTGLEWVSAKVFAESRGFKGEDGFWQGNSIGSILCPSRKESNTEQCCCQTKDSFLVNQYLRSSFLDKTRERGTWLSEGGVIRRPVGRLPGRREERVEDGKASSSSFDSGSSYKHGCMHPEIKDASIISVESIGEMDVYDISVEGDHSYYAGGLFHHNSTRSPSLHTIPRKSSIKKLFISRYGEDGLIGQGDLSQAEVRAFVIETGDTYLRDSFIQGLDPYESMASKTFSIPISQVTESQRQDNKSIVLGLLFGRGAIAIAKQTGKQVDEIKEIIFYFFQGMPKLKRYIEFQHDFVDKFKVVVSRFGRIRPLIDEINSDDDEMLSHAHNIAVNHPIQGMVGDLCIDSVARLEYEMRRRNYLSAIFNTVHDSTILDIYIPELLEVMPLVKEEMYTKLQSYFPWINVPFAIDQELGLNWGSGIKASTEGNRLTLNGAPDIINSVMGRIAKHFVPSAIVFDSYIGKNKQPALKFSCDLAKR